MADEFLAAQNDGTLFDTVRPLDMSEDPEHAGLEHYELDEAGRASEELRRTLRSTLAKAAQSDEDSALERGRLADEFREHLPPFRVRLAGGEPDISHYLASAQREYRPKWRPFTVTLRNVGSLVRTAPQSDSPSSWLSFITHPIARAATVALGLSPYRVERPLLSDLNLVFKPKEMVLLLGVPGAGSSVLLELIGHRTKSPHVTKGEILANGVKIRREHAARDIALVRQSDVHTALLTVAESLDYAIAMQIPGSVPAEKHRERRDMILEVLGLSHRANTLVGNQGLRGISGGERRRLSVGVEMGRFPSLYLLDEPTSGLDAAMSFRLCHAFRGIAHSGPPVVMALKQPPFEIAALFDRVVVLGANGRIAFNGTIREGLEHFERLGFECPAFVNPTDFFLDCQSNPCRYTQRKESASMTVDDFTTAYAESERSAEEIRAVEAQYELRRQLEHTRAKKMERKLSHKFVPKKVRSKAAKAKARLGVQVGHSGFWNDVSSAAAVDDDEDIEHYEEMALLESQVEDADEEEEEEEKEGKDSSPEQSKGMMERLNGMWRKGKRRGVKELKGLPKRVWGGVQRLEEVAVSKVLTSNDYAYYDEGEYARSNVEQLKAALQRGFVTMRRSKQMLIMKVLRTLLTGILVSTLFWQLGSTQEDTQLMASLLFFTITFFCFSSMSGLPAIYDERAVLYRDLDMRLTRTLPYLVSSVLVNLPAIVLELVIYDLLVYFGSGLSLADNGWRFANFFLVTGLVSLNSDAFARLVSSLTPKLELATTLDPLFDMMGFIFAGYLLPRSDIPKYFLELHWANPVTYAFYALMQNEFVGKSLYCKDSEMVPPLNDPRLNLAYPFGFQGVQVCPMTNGRDLLDRFDIDDDTDAKWLYLIPLVFFYLLFLVAAYFGFSYVQWRPRPRPTRKALEERTFAVRVVSRAYDNAKALLDKALARAGLPTDAWFEEHEEKADDKEAASMWNQETQMRACGLDNPMMVRKLAALQYMAMHAPGGGLLTWQKLNYRVSVGSIPLKKKRLHLLHDIAGFVRPGMALALMGASGAGKTTLLDVLARRKTTGKAKGDVLLNGRPVPKNFHRYMGYVEQTDVHEASQTVAEAVRFSALTRMDGGWVPGLSTYRKLTFAKKVLDAMRLTEIAQRRVGRGQGDGLSPEERKRLTFAVELAANPSVIFLDEPTTGLDTVGAANVVEAIESVAKSGRSVICTVHQPSMQAFAAFTHVLILVPGGRVAYFGPIHNDANERDFGALKDYFARYGFVCPTLANPADFILSVVTDGRASLADSNLHTVGHEENEEEEEEEEKKKKEEVHPVDALEGLEEETKEELKVLLTLRDDGDRAFRAASATFWSRQYEASDMYRQALATASRDADKMAEEGEGPYPVKGGSKATPGLVQFLLVMWRAILQRWRDPVNFYVRVLASVGMGIMLGLVFLQLDDTQAGLNGRISVLFMTVLFSVVMTVPLASEIIQERWLFFRERLAGSYGYMSYVLRLVLVDLVLNSFYSVLMMVPLYLMVGLRLNFGWFVYLYLMSFLTTMLSISFGQFVAMVAPNQGVATEVVTTALSLSMTFAGFFIPRDKMPVYWSWASWLSFMSYPLESALVSQLRGMDFTCTDSELIPVPVPDANHLKYVCPIPNGDIYLNLQNYDDPESLYRNPLVMVGYILLFLLLASIFIRIKKQVNR